MKTKIQHVLGSLLATLFIFFTLTQSAFAAQTVSAEGYYTVGDGPDENISVAKERARVDAQRKACEQACLLVESDSEERMGLLTKDEVRTIAAQILKVIDEKITAELLGDNIIRYHCFLVAEVSDSNVIDALMLDRQKLAESAQKEQEYEARISALTNEIGELKAQYKAAATEAQRTEIQADINANEHAFRANEWIRKGDELREKSNYASRFRMVGFSSEAEAEAFNQKRAAFSKAYTDKLRFYYQNAINENPNNPIGYIRMSQTISGKSTDGPGVPSKYFTEKLPFLQKALSVDANSFEALNEIVSLYLWEAEYAEKMDRKKNPSLYISDRANAFLTQGVEYFQKADAVAPDEFKRHRRRGIFYRWMKSRYAVIDGRYVYIGRENTNITKEDRKEYRKYYQDLASQEWQEAVDCAPTPQEKSSALLSCTTSTDEERISNLLQAIELDPTNYLAYRYLHNWCHKKSTNPAKQADHDALVEQYNLRAYDEEYEVLTKKKDEAEKLLYKEFGIDL